MSESRTWSDVRRRIKDRPRGTTLRLANYLGMDASYLRRKLQTDRDLTLREAEQISEFLDDDTSENGAPEPSSGRRVPVYGYAAMGAAGLAEEGDVIAVGSSAVLDWMELPLGLNPRGECFVVYPIGSSMEPRIFAGEPLLVLLRVPPVREGDALIEFNDGTAVVKSYQGQRDGRVFTRQFNPDRVRDYDATKVKAIHRIIRL